MFNSYDDYVAFLATLLDRFVYIQTMEFKVYLTSVTEGYSEGTMRFSHELVLSFNEHIDFAAKRLFKYGYVAYQRGVKLFYYDPQPHPNDPSLASNFPHHKHIHPDLKHHRIPAPEMTFENSNLETVIREIETMILSM